MLRLLLSPKWMAWHVLTLGAMVTCGWLAAWQWGRAGSAMGSALNIGYGLQWPLFALFFGIMWWRFLRLEINDLRAAQAVEEAAADPPASVPAAGAPERAATDPVTAERTSGTQPAAERATAGPVTTERAAGGPATAVAERATAPATAAPAPRPSPFTARPAGVTAPPPADPQLRAYNEELARLAAQHEEATP
ncbi:hypothetical protein [Pseudonocardia sp. NPDC049635]|uniref:hypothetical protein n=1 Tax=Pseudonocardia sp. NPDC049635 TaxID=3155506 RepID=UPI00340E97CF